MKKTFALLTAAILSAGTLYAADTMYGKAMEKAHAVRAKAETNWYTDLDEAKAEAAKSGKVLFILFTGSDWCPWCVKLEKEILSEEEFARYAAKNLILFKADMTGKTEQKQAEKIKNQMNKYHAGGFPMVILENSKGKVIGRTGYMRGGSAAFVKKLDSIIRK